MLSLKFEVCMRASAVVASDMYQVCWKRMDPLSVIPPGTGLFAKNERTCQGEKLTAGSATANVCTMNQNDDLNNICAKI